MDLQRDQRTRIATSMRNGLTLFLVGLFQDDAGHPKVYPYSGAISLLQKCQIRIKLHTSWLKSAALLESVGV